MDTSKKITVTFFALSATAQLPTHGTYDSAGYDLYSDIEKAVPPGRTTLVQTNVGIMLPKGTYGRIAPRSSLAYKKSIDVFGGVIDSDYRDQIGVILYNAGTEAYYIKQGERIAQLIIERHYHQDEVNLNWMNVDSAKLQPEWSSSRTGGFGSTG